MQTPAGSYRRMTTKRLPPAGLFLSTASSTIRSGVKLPKTTDSNPRRKRMMGIRCVLCVACGKTFPFSYIYDRFGHPLCDSCRESDPSGKLITRTEAKDKYLLKDCDLDVRNSKLPFISKKNPHNPRWGDMKLYLRIQVEKRALEVWENWESLEQAKQQKQDLKDQRREKLFEKKLKDLRRQAKGEGRRYERPKPHEHSYGSETYNSEKDVYSKTCHICQHKLTFEKM